MEGRDVKKLTVHIAQVSDPEHMAVQLWGLTVAGTNGTNYQWDNRRGFLLTPGGELRIKLGKLRRKTSLVEVSLHSPSKKEEP